MNAPLVLTPEQAKPAFDLNLVPGPIGHMGEFFGALAAAQGGFQPIEKNKRVDVRSKDLTRILYSFWYADMGEIRARTTPALAEQHLTATSIPTMGDKGNGGQKLRTIIGHVSGSYMESTLVIPSTTDVKDFGGYITYLRRYVLSAMLGVAADDDLDSSQQGEPDDDGAGERQSPGPTPFRSPSPGAPAEHPLLTAAVSVGALTRQFNQFSPENKEKFTAHYERRLDELEPKAPATESAATTERKDDL